MRTFYSEQLSPIKLAVIDAHDLDATTWRICRVMVPVGYQGRGVGARLMREICSDADRAGIKLHLEPMPYDGPDRLDDLVRFYERFDFKMCATGMVRAAQPL